MKRTLQILLFFLVIFLSGSVWAGTNAVAESTATKSGTVWKFEQDLSKYAFLDGISKKIYYLTLFLDGTYHQFVQIIPSNSKNYYGVRYYELDGDWQYKDNKLFLDENGKKNAIDYEYFNANFENIDNLLIPEE
jgi:hypothetical protein